MNDNKATMGGAASRRPRHMELHEEIERTDLILSQLEDLINQINGNDRMEQPVLVDEKVRLQAPEPTLFQVLNEGGERMHHQNTRLQEQINYLKDLLF